MPEERSSIGVGPKLLSGGFARDRLTPPQPSEDHKPDPGRSPKPTESANRLGTSVATARNIRDPQAANRVIHPSWLALIEVCRELGHGEIDRLSIQDGLPVLAETVKKKVRFPR